MKRTVVVQWGRHINPTPSRREMEDVDGKLDGKLQRSLSRLQELEGRLSVGNGGGGSRPRVSATSLRSERRRDVVPAGSPAKHVGTVGGGGCSEKERTLLEKQIASLEAALRDMELQVAQHQAAEKELSESNHEFETRIQRKGRENATLVRQCDDQGKELKRLKEREVALRGEVEHYKAFVDRELHHSETSKGAEINHRNLMQTNDELQREVLLARCGEGEQRRRAEKAEERAMMAEDEAQMLRKRVTESEADRERLTKDNQLLSMQVKQLERDVIRAKERSDTLRSDLVGLNAKCQVMEAALHATSPVSQSTRTSTPVDRRRSAGLTPKQQIQRDMDASFDLFTGSPLPPMVSLSRLGSSSNVSSGRETTKPSPSHPTPAPAPAPAPAPVPPVPDPSLARSSPSLKDIHTLKKIFDLYQAIQEDGPLGASTTTNVNTNLNTINTRGTEAIPVRDDDGDTTENPHTPHAVGNGKAMTPSSGLHVAGRLDFEGDPAQQAEEELTHLLHEKSLLEAEFSRLPLSSSLSLPGRKRKEEIEERLDRLASDISRHKMLVQRSKHGSRRF